MRALLMRALLMLVLLVLVRARSLEKCNYNTGKMCNHVPAAKGPGARHASPERMPLAHAPYYTPEVG